MTLSLFVRRCLTAVPLLPVLIGAAPDPGSLEITVTNVRNAKGHVRVDICAEKDFLSDHCAYHGAAPAHYGDTRITVTGLPPGRYAVQAYHDENDNQDVDRALFGIPKEGIGFSRDAPASFGPPSWNKAVFDQGANGTAITLKMRYMLGKGGPQDR